MSSDSLVQSTSPPGSLLAFIRRLHFYIGLFIAPFIFIAALTGTLYVLTPQLENLIYREVLTTQPQGSPQSLTRQIQAAREYSGNSMHIYAVRPAPEATSTTRVQFSDPALGASESRSVFIDPYTLQVTGDMTVYGTSGSLPFRTWIDQLHQSLLLGDAGRYYSELAASWLWIAALGGVILWGTGRKRRQSASRSVMTTRQWHILSGGILFIGLLFFSATGLTWSQWAGSRIDLLRTELNWLTPQVNTRLNDSAPPPVADSHADHQTSPSTGVKNQPVTDWEQVLASARLAGIDAEKIELRQPAQAGRAWTVTEIDRRWPTRVDAVSVAPDSFRVVDHVRFSEFPLIAKLTRWGIDAHMGILFGLPNQLIVAAFGLGLCAMIVLGYRLWWLRRPAPPETSPTQTLSSAWLALPLYWKLISLCFIGFFSYALPMTGVSLLAFIILDGFRWKSGQSAHAHQPPSPSAHQSPSGIIRSRFASKPREAKYFLRGVGILACIVFSVMIKAIIGGAIDEYHIPFSQWSAEMYITQFFMITIYSCVFTALLSIPLWYFFLGEEESE